MPSTPFPTSLCHGCRHLRRVEGARSTFLKCEAPSPSDADGNPASVAPAPARYPPQPVLRCPTFAPASTDAGGKM